MSDNLRLRKLGVIGIDESGKGDFFGSLVTAAAWVDDATAIELRNAGVRDCKKLSDAQVLSLAPVVKQLVRFAVVKASPRKLAQAYEKLPNGGNTILAFAHANAAAQVWAMLQADGITPEKIVSDQFANPDFLREQLAKKIANFGEIEFISVTKAEDRFIAVAAASIIARAEFLEDLRAMSLALGINLPKGASTQVIEAGKQILRERGEQALLDVCKTSFKTYRTVLDAVPVSERAQPEAQDMEQPVEQPNVEETTTPVQVETRTMEEQPVNESTINVQAETVNEAPGTNMEPPVNTRRENRSEGEMIYVGIGQLTVTDEVREWLADFASRVAHCGWHLRSGANNGVDTVFEQNSGGKFNVYLPWNKFGRRPSGRRFTVCEELPAYDLAKEQLFNEHPKPDALDAKMVKLLVRARFEILGDDLNTPCKFVACYSEAGLDAAAVREAVRLARERGIPVFDLASMKAQGMTADEAIRAIYRELGMAEPESTEVPEVNGWAEVIEIRDRKFVLETRETGTCSLKPYDRAGRIIWVNVSGGRILLNPVPRPEDIEPETLEELVALLTELWKSGAIWPKGGDITKLTLDLGDGELRGEIVSRRGSSDRSGFIVFKHAVDGAEPVEYFINEYIDENSGETWLAFNEPVKGATNEQMVNLLNQVQVWVNDRILWPNKLVVRQSRALVQSGINIREYVQKSELVEEGLLVEVNLYGQPITLITDWRMVREGDEIKVVPNSDPLYDAIMHFLRMQREADYNDADERVVKAGKRLLGIALEMAARIAAESKTTVADALKAKIVTSGAVPENEVYFDGDNVFINVATAKKYLNADSDGDWMAAILGKDSDGNEVVMPTKAPLTFQPPVLRLRRAKAPMEKLGACDWAKLLEKERKKKQGRMHEHATVVLSSEFTGHLTNKAKRAVMVAYGVNRAPRLDVGLATGKFYASYRDMIEYYMAGKGSKDALPVTNAVDIDTDDKRIVEVPQDADKIRINAPDWPMRYSMKYVDAKVKEKFDETVGPSIYAYFKMAGADERLMAALQNNEGLFNKKAEDLLSLIESSASAHRIMLEKVKNMTSVHPEFLWLLLVSYGSFRAAAEAAYTVEPQIIAVSKAEGDIVDTEEDLKKYDPVAEMENAGRSFLALPGSGAVKNAKQCGMLKWEVVNADRPWLPEGARMPKMVRFTLYGPNGEPMPFYGHEEGHCMSSYIVPPMWDAEKQTWVHPADALDRWLSAKGAGVFPQGRDGEMKPFPGPFRGGNTGGWYDVQAWPIAGRMFLEAMGDFFSTFGIPVVGDAEPDAEDLSLMSSAMWLVFGEESGRNAERRLVATHLFAGKTGIPVAYHGAKGSIPNWRRMLVGHYHGGPWIGTDLLDDPKRAQIFSQLFPYLKKVNVRVAVAWYGEVDGSRITPEGQELIWVPNKTVLADHPENDESPEIEVFDIKTGTFKVKYLVEWKLDRNGKLVFRNGGKICAGSCGRIQTLDGEPVHVLYSAYEAASKCHLESWMREGTLEVIRYEDENGEWHEVEALVVNTTAYRTFNWGENKKAEEGKGNGVFRGLIGKWIQLWAEEARAQDGIRLRVNERSLTFEQARMLDDLEKLARILRERFGSPVGTKGTEFPKIFKPRRDNDNARVNIRDTRNNNDQDGVDDRSAGD